MIALTCHFSESGRPVRGYVAIDSFANGSASGGVRMREGVTADELRLLAANMTLKFGFLGIPQGGAKGGISFDPEAPVDERRRVLFRFGQLLAPLLLQRIFIPGPDLGTSPEDVLSMLRGAGRKPSRIQFSDEGSGHYTGLSVFVGGREGLAALEIPLQGASVAIEGFGRVGAAAAQFFASAGARVVGVSTKEGGLFHDQGLPVPELIQASAAMGPSFVNGFAGAKRISAEELASLPVDVLCPCALHHAIHAGNMGTIRARIISSGANVALTPEAEAYLVRQSVLVLPDFITNSGGILGVFLEVAGCDVAENERLIPELLAPRIRELIHVSQARGLSTSEIAKKVFLDRFKRLKAEVESRTVKGRLMQQGTVRFARRLTPRPVSKRLGVAYFRQRLAGPMFENV
jgi:glutamate dehydrogenase (NAD(P)+)